MQSFAEALRSLPDAVQGKLKSTGYTSADAIAGASLRDLEVDVGIPTDVGALLLRTARSEVRQLSGQLPVPAVTSAASASASSVSCMCRGIDEMLGGGVKGSEVTEIVGAPGSGKTQLLLQLAVAVQLPRAAGGLDTSAVILDTEGGVRTERICEMVQAASDLVARRTSETPLPAESWLERISYLRLHDATELVAVIAALPQLLGPDGRWEGAGVVLIDSIAAPFRQMRTADAAAGAQRQRLLSSVGQRLKRLAESTGVAVVVTNHLTTHQGASGDSKSVYSAALGSVWGHEVTTRVLMSMRNGRRFAALVKSPRLPAGESPFAVTGRGIRDCRQEDAGDASKRRRVH
eukprot:TRINITY_DN47004_c0_g1_i1.p1 TRINITY_DN47004_c0_g1~~TRINITY_DN47004_c0_g1_i1.p1  ORF type:complete len:348 (+),score=65.22 TRINITY_DN47004_c0_g1_i1:49-1092(+)